MYIYFNPNPKNKSVGDCTVRAVSKVLGISWEEAYWSLCTVGNDEGDMPNSNAVVATLMKQKGFKRKIIPDTCPRCYTLTDFVEDHPNGAFLVAFGTHAVAVRDGSYFDSWDSGNEIPIYYFTEVG